MRFNALPVDGSFSVVNACVSLLRCKTILVIFINSSNKKFGFATLLQNDFIDKTLKQANKTFGNKIQQNKVDVNIIVSIKISHDVNNDNVIYNTETSVY